MQKIKKVSALIRRLIMLLIAFRVAIMVLVPVSEFHFPSTESKPDEAQFSIDYIINVQDSWKSYAVMLENENLSSVLILGLPEQIFTLVVYYLLLRLFRCFEQGLVFAPVAISKLRMIGGCILLWPLVVVLYPALTSLIIHLIGVSDSLPLTLTFGSSEITPLIVGLMIYVISWIMLEAQKVSEEQELTI